MNVLYLLMIVITQSARQKKSSGTLSYNRCDEFSSYYYTVNHLLSLSCRVGLPGITMTVVEWSYRDILLMCTLCVLLPSFDRQYVYNIHAVKYVCGRVGGDFKLPP